MRLTRGVAPLAGLVALACGLVAWEWFAHISRPVPQPVQQIAAATPIPAPTVTPTQSPVVYVPRATATPVPLPPTAAPASVSAPEQAASSEATVTPSPAVTPTPYAAGTPAVAQEPMVVETLAPHVANVAPVRENADAPPRILSMSISTPVAHGGEIVSGTVETTSNVAAVEARIAGYATSMQKIGVGRFALSYRVPNLPFFLHRTYTIEVIARNTRGDAVTSSVPITIR